MRPEKKMPELVNNQTAQKEILMILLNTERNLFHTEVQTCQKECRETVNRSVNIMKIEYKQ